MADPTLCGLVGVSPADTVTMNGAERPIDGIDVWPLLLSRASQSPREYLPTTEHSLIWKGRWKLITLAGGFNKPWDPTQIQGQVGYGGWYPPALGSNDTHGSPGDPGPQEWPCVGPAVGWGQCAVCTDARPCLFDIIADPSERVNQAPKQPAIVAQMARQLATYTPYIDKGMGAAELSKYECLTTNISDSAPFGSWWGDFMGPCCRKRQG